jgi:dynein heavy chain 1
LIGVQVKDQQETERRKVMSQEIQVSLEKQTAIIAEKQASVKEDLSKVEPAVLEAQNGGCRFKLYILYP